MKKSLFYPRRENKIKQVDANEEFSLLDFAYQEF